MALDAAVVSSVGSGLLLLALGIAVGLVRPRRRVNVAFAVFSAGFGLYFAFTNIVAPGHPWKDLTYVLGGAAIFPAIVALLYVARRLPEPLDARDRGAAIGALALAALVGIPQAAGLGTYYATVVVDPSAARIVQGFLLQAFVIGLWGVSFLLALRTARAETVRSARNSALFGAAIVLYPAYVAGAGSNTGESLLTGEFALVLYGVSGLAAALVAAALWLWASTRGPEPRMARRVAWTALGMALLGMASHSWGLPGVGYGIARSVAVLLLGYAILRHQLLGMDVRVKVTVKRSTLAAAFVGLFFVVSESAQALFSDRVGTFLGIAAAGMLVFALAPLQRLAERVADVAMPGVKGASEMTRDERHGFYREQVRIAWADGALTADERRLLESTRAQLGLSVEEAARIEHEVGPR